MFAFIALANWHCDIVTVQFAHDYGDQSTDHPVFRLTNLHTATLWMCDLKQQKFNILHVLLSIPPNLNIVIAISLRSEFVMIVS